MPPATAALLDDLLDELRVRPVGPVDPNRPGRSVFIGILILPPAVLF